MFVLPCTTKRGIIQSSRARQCSRSLRTIPPPHLPSITVHLLHDNTLTDDNRDKFIQIAERYRQQLKFYNVEELCADRLEKIEECFPKVNEAHVSIATFYRFFIPHLLLPQKIEKAIYLDSDIIVNLDIAEFWQVELGDKPLGAIPEVDIGVPLKKECPLVSYDVVEEENYFNAGILLMNLKALHKEEDTILKGIKFIIEHPQFPYFDQDILNYCFSTSYLKLPVKFNRFVGIARRDNEQSINKKIYHYVDMKYSFIMDTNDPYNQLFMKYFLKTPWVDADTEKSLSGTSLPYRKIPAVSVVIPMYNEEKRISDCLDSLLIQTFQDFEVIVVDDCSTDNSVEVVESYMPKFNGRLKLASTEKNSGSDCPPRNIGLMLARGEYIQFIDSDDMILGTALETLYKAAILYEVDVVYTSSCYYWNAPNNIFLYKDGTSQKMNWVNTDLVIDDPSTNLSRLLLEPREGNFHAAWTKFVRRDFMLRNKIFFFYLPLAGDFAGVIDMYCHARRFLRISTPLYFYRTFNDHAMSRRTRPPQEQCRHWFSSFVKFAKSLYELEKEHEVLAENPLYCLEAARKTFGWTLNQTYSARKELDSEEVYKFLHRELFKTSGDLAAILPFLFSFIEKEDKNKGKSKDYYSKIFNKFRLYYTARIFVLIDKKMDRETIQLLSVSDDKAELSKPDWWQREGTCHVINSYTGDLDIVAKTITEGNVQLRLGGDYVANKNHAGLIPYWIDFTKLVINGKTIFNTPTPTWHDKPYVYDMVGVKANEEIKIHIEWQPYRADTIEIAPPPKPEPKVETPKVTAPEQKVIILQPPKIESSTSRKFNPFTTARIDAKFMSTTGDFQILSTSDDKASVSKPNWFQRNGIGYIVQSSDGELMFVAKATANGKINLNLRGMDVRNSEDWANGIAKRIPYWIDYTKLTVNGKNIFNTRISSWCDKPYACIVEAKANEEIKIQVEWQPHKSDT